MQRWDGGGQRLADGLGTAAKVKVHYRLDGASRSATFSGPACEDTAAEFRALLAAAYAGDWLPDERHRPVVPAHAGPSPTPAGFAAARPLPIAAAAAGPVGVVVDIADLAKRQMRRHERGHKRRGGGERSPTTTGNYETNLRTRKANDAAMRAWARTVEHEERLARRDGRSAVVPAAPELVEERASARTIEEMCRELKSLFTQAHQRGEISYQPWTADVADHQVRAQPVAYTTASLPNPDQVRRLAATMRGMNGTTTDRDRRRIEVDGERYGALVELAGFEGLREEELGGLRPSWLELDRAAPRIAVRGGEVFHRAGDGPRVRTVVPLKHRLPGTVRYLDLSHRPELVACLREHIDRFVAVPDERSGDHEARDPHVFTNHRGDPIDFGNWVGRWWAPTIAATFAVGDEAERLGSLPFRRLRAAAITSWLRDGRSLDWCARRAGNTQGVIEKHYRGVLDEIGYEDDAMAPTPVAPVGAGADLASLSVDELAALHQAAGMEFARRARAG